MIQPAKFFLFFLPFSLFLLSSCHSNSLKIVTVTVTSSEGQAYRLENVEVASTTTEHEKGLMHRKSLASDSGMLFIYPKERLGSFWMKNTLVPLAIAFIDNRGTIIEILHGKNDFDWKKLSQKIMYFVFSFKLFNLCMNIINL